MNIQNFPTLKTSIKEFENYKTCHPEKTVQRLTDALKQAGYEYEYIVLPQKYLPNKLDMHHGKIMSLDRSFRSAGKGLSPILCKASAFAEFVERLSAPCCGFRQVTPLIKQYRALSKTLIVSSKKEIDSTFRDEYFYENGLRSIASSDQRQRIESAIQLWGKIYSLTKKRTVFYPFIWHHTKNLTNGISSGNTIEEALVHGICEVLERSVRMESLQGRKFQIIDINTLPEKYKNWIKILKKRFVEVKLYDMTTYGIPIIGAEMRFMPRKRSLWKNPIQKKWNSRVVKVGVAPSPYEALDRCFTEFYQNYSDFDEHHHSLINKFSNTIQLFGWDDNVDTPFLTSGGHCNVDLQSFECKYRDFSAIPDISNNDCKVEVENLISLLQNNEIEVFVEDLTDRVIQFPVVKVIIPDLTPLNIWENVDSILDTVVAAEEVSKGQFRHYDNLSDPNNLYHSSIKLYSSILSGEWKSDKVKLDQICKSLQSSIRMQAVATHGPSSLFGWGATLLTMIDLYLYKNHPDKALIIAEEVSNLVSSTDHLFWGVLYILQKEWGNPSSADKSLKKIPIKQREKILIDAKKHISTIQDNFNFFESCDFSCINCTNDFVCPMRDLAKSKKLQHLVD